MLGTTFVRYSDQKTCIQQLSIQVVLQSLNRDISGGNMRISDYVNLKPIQNRVGCDPKLIEQFEIEYGIKIPNYIVECLVEFNGAIVSPSTIDIPQISDSTTMGYLLGYEDMYRMKRNFKDNLPNSYLPFGSDPGGSFFCINTEDERHPVYFFDLESAQQINGIYSYKYYRIANNIADYLRALY
jgi:hypothetical protein